MLDPAARRRQKARNVLHSALLLVCLLAVTAGLAWLLLGTVGLFTLLAIGVLVLAVRPRVPVRAVLALFRAEPLPYAAAPWLHQAVRELARRAGLDATPALYRVPSSVPNAFTVGLGERAVLGVTDGLLQTLPPRETVAVLAHEVSHLHSGDTVVMGLSAALGRFATVMAWVGIVALLIGLPAAGGAGHVLVLATVLLAFPLVVTALRMAFSRSREFDADLGAAGLTGDPEALAEALEELELVTTPFWDRILLPQRHSPGVLVRTHPATAERARRLRRLEVRTARSPWDGDWRGFPVR